MNISTLIQELKAQFETLHGITPTVLRLNPQAHNALSKEVMRFVSTKNMGCITKFDGMEVEVLSPLEDGFIEIGVKNRGSR